MRPGGQKPWADPDSNSQPVWYNKLFLHVSLVDLIADLFGFSDSIKKHRNRQYDNIVSVALPVVRRWGSLTHRSFPLTLAS